MNEDDFLSTLFMFVYCVNDISITLFEHWRRRGGGITVVRLSTFEFRKTKIKEQQRKRKYLKCCMFVLLFCVFATCIYIHFFHFLFSTTRLFEKKFRFAPDYWVMWSVGWDHYMQPKVFKLFVPRESDCSLT